LTTQQLLETVNQFKKEINIASTKSKNEALEAMAIALLEDTDAILKANALDLEKAKGHITDVMLDRLRLDESRIQAMAEGIRQVAQLPDPVGEVIEETVGAQNIEIKNLCKVYGNITILDDINFVAKEGRVTAFLGPNGAGHYVKMVHNGIEYGDMQLIAESYDILRRVGGLTVEETAEVFKSWNTGELDSYLIEITADILTKKDPETGKPMVEVIMDTAGNKGTGKWTSQSALDLGVPLPLITESVFARYISTLKEEREVASKELSPIKVPELSNTEKQALVESVRKGLYFSKIMSYAQGFAQMRVASEEFDWNLNYGEIAKIFRAGCIIRAQFLQKITDAFERDPELKNLLLDKYFLYVTESYQEAVREVVVTAVQAGIPVPTFSSALAYYDSYRSEVLPANLIQAQRDYFGAHTYNRVDKPGVFHFEWAQEREIEQ